MVHWIAEWALARNVLPLIALRGYRSLRGRRLPVRAGIVRPEAFPNP